MSNYENRIQRDLVTDAVFTESNEDFILPDYMPEIGRVLRVSAVLLPEAHYEGSDETEFSGRIEYRLLYGDGEGNITEAPLEGRYRYRVANGGKASLVTDTEERIESVNARPTSPRKLSIRTRIYARPCMLTEETLGVSPTSLFGSLPFEAITNEAEVLERDSFSSGTLHAEGRFALENLSPDDVTLIAVEAVAAPEGKEARNGYLSLRGSLVFTLLLKKGEELPFVKVCTLPFEEEITAEGAKVGDHLCLRAFVASPTVTFEADGDGTSLLIDTEYSLSGMLSRNQRISFPTDLYAHGVQTTLDRRSVSLEKLQGTAATCLTVSADAPLPEEMRTGTLLPRFTLKESCVSRVGEKAVAEGVLSVLLLSFGERMTEKCELALPFRAELSLPSREGEVLSLSVTPLYGSAQANGETVHLSAEISVSVLSHLPFSISLPISAERLADAPRTDAATLLLYYPTDSDTLFSVGKKYGVPISSLKRLNGIPEAEESTAPLDGYSYLFVNEV